MAGSVMDVVLGTAVLIKNGIGMAGAVIAAGICIIPIVKLLLLAFLYKTVAAVTQRYRTNELQHVSEGSVRDMKCL